MTFWPLQVHHHVTSANLWLFRKNQKARCVACCTQSLKLIFPQQAGQWQKQHPHNLTMLKAKSVALQPLLSTWNDPIVQVFLKEIQSLMRGLLSSTQEDAGFAYFVCWQSSVVRMYASRQCCIVLARVAEENCAVVWRTFRRHSSWITFISYVSSTSNRISVKDSRLKTQTHTLLYVLYCTSRWRRGGAREKN